MRNLFLTHLELIDESGRLRSYDYFITIDETNTGFSSCESYGICIAEQGGLRSSVRGITSSISRIDALSQLLVRNKVTPITLADVVSDWL